MIYVFGDSFARFFTLIKKSKVTVHSFKGATLKGIVKPKSANRIAIEKIIKNSSSISYAIFIFGQVDLNLSFYYDLCKSSVEPYSSGEMFKSHYDAYIKQYVEWITSIPGKFRRVILCTYPSPLDQVHTIKSLIIYGTLTKKVVEHRNKDITFCTTDIVRRARYFEFIYTIEKYCDALKLRKYSKFNNANFYYSNVEFISLSKHLLDSNSLAIHPNFIDISEYNMHIMWEPVIPLLISELRQIGVPIDDADIVSDIDNIQKKYIVSKKDRIVKNQYHYDMAN